MYLRLYYCYIYRPVEHKTLTKNSHTISQCSPTPHNTICTTGETGKSTLQTLPFKSPEFDWNASNLYSQFKLFKTKVEFAFKGTYKDNPGHAKVGAVLNWLGNTAFEIYGNFIWTTAADKDDPLKVLKAFEDYF